MQQSPLSGWSSRPAVILALALSLGVVELEASAPRWTVDAEPAGIASLSSSTTTPDDTAKVIGRVKGIAGYVGDPILAEAGRGLLLSQSTDRGIRLVHVALPTGTVTDLSDRASDEVGSMIVALAGGDGQMAVHQRPGPLVSVLGSDLRSQAQFSAVVFSAIVLELAGDHLYGIGFPIITDEALTLEKLRDARWRGERSRPECQLFRANWRQPKQAIEPIVCDEAFRAMEGAFFGDILAHDDRVYAVVGTKPSLFVVQPDGSVVETSYLEAGEQGFDLSPSEIAAEKRDRDLFWRLRGEHPWFQGLVPIDGGVGLVFRTWDGEVSRFTMDVFDRQGQKQADDVPIPIPPRGRTAHGLPANIGDQVFLLIKGVADDGASYFQELYRLTIDGPEGTTVVGRVVDEAGAAVPEVTVEALVPVADDPSARRRRTTATRVDGRFALDALPVGRTLIGLRHDGLRKHDRWLTLGSAPQVDLGTIVVGPGRTVSLMVEDDWGPVVEARIVDEESEDVVHSDATGRAQVVGLAVDRPSALRIDSPEHQSITVPLPLDVAEPLRVHLERASALVLELRDLETGVPIDEVRGELRHGMNARIDTWQGEEGRFRIPLDPWPTVDVELRADGYLPMTLTIAGEAEGVHDLGTVWLDRGASIVGTLVGFDGLPLVGASIEVTDPDRRGSAVAAALGKVRSVSSDDDGRFALSGFEAGAVCLVVRHPAIADTAIPVTAVAADETRDLGTYRLARPVPVGEVVDRDGEPVGAVDVQLRAGTLRHPCLRYERRADADGQVTWPAVAPGDYHAVVRQRGQILGQSRLAVQADDEEAAVTVRVERLRIEGVVTIAGSPVRGGTLHLEAAGAPEAGPPVFLQQVGRGAGGGQTLLSDLPGTAVARVGDDGRYRVAGSLPPGLLRARFESSEHAETFVRWAEVPPDVSTMHLDLVFDGRSVRGRLLDDQGAPVHGAWIEARRQGVETRRVLSAVDGTFVLTHLAPGLVELIAVHGPLRGDRQLMVASEDLETVEILMAPHRPPRLQVAVRSRDDQPVPAVTHWLSDGKQTHRTLRGDRLGATVFAGIEPGAYSLVSRWPGGGVAVTETQVDEAEHQRLTVRPDRFGQMTLRWAPEHAGTPIEVLTDKGLSLRPLFSLTGTDLYVDEAGEVRLPPLAHGTWWVRLGGAGDPPQRIEIVRARDTRRMD